MKKLVVVWLVLLACLVSAGAAASGVDIGQTGGESLLGAVPEERRGYLDGIQPEILWERKPLSLAQVEKAVGKKIFAESVSEFVTKKTGKPALVETSDKRPAITNKISAAEAFKEENEHE